MDMNRILERSRTDAYRYALSLWAEQGGYSNDEIQAWFTDVMNTYPTIDHIPYNEPVWERMFIRFPINLPRDANGKVDVDKLDDMDLFNRALITAQAAEVMYTCATGGGDDTWFDYLPAGIRLLDSLQAEDWATVFAEYVDTVVSIEDDDERMDAEIAFDEKGHFYVMDVTTPLLSFYLRK